MAARSFRTHRPHRSLQTFRRRTKTLQRNHRLRPSGVQPRRGASKRQARRHGRLWFQVYSPHRTRWQTYSLEEKKKLIHDHASTVFEDYCRGRHPQAARYLEANVEFDYVRDERGRAVVSEVKFKRLSAAERKQLDKHLAAGWQRSALSRRYRDVTFEILDASVLAS